MDTPKEKTTARKSTETAKKVRSMVKGLSQRAHESRAMGLPIAYLFVAAVYDDILRAMDIAVVGTENFAGVCAAKKDAERFIAKAEAEGYSRYLCTYATCGLGFDCLRRELGGMPPQAPDGGMEEPTVMLGTGQMRCDPRYLWYQAEQRYVDAPLHVVSLLNPPLYYTHADYRELKAYYLKYVVDELNGLVEFLEKQTGRQLDPDRLRRVVDLSERTIRVWHDAYELRKAVPAPMPTQDALNTMFPGFNMMGTQEAYDFYRELYDEVAYRVEHKIGAVTEEKYRLLWGISLPPWHALDVFSYFESKGAVFPIEVVYHPQRPVDIPSDVNDPMERLAWRFWDLMTMNYERAQARGVTDPWVGWYLDLIDEYRLDGVVLHQAKTCRTIHTGQIHQINLLKKHTDKPVLLLEGDIVDATAYNEAQTLDRIDAFIEMLEGRARR